MLSFSTPFSYLSKTSDDETLCLLFFQTLHDSRISKRASVGREVFDRRRRHHSLSVSQSAAVAPRHAGGVALTGGWLISLIAQLQTPVVRHGGPGLSSLRR